MNLDSRGMLVNDDYSLTAQSGKVWYRTRLIAFIGGSILVAFILVIVSMALYISSGAAELDLSRPGYQSVQGQVERSDAFKSFPASGPVNAATIDEFQRLFDEQVKQVMTVDAFNPDVLGDQALGINAPGADQ
jgi:hypothetical protein